MKYRFVQISIIAATLFTFVQPLFAQSVGKVSGHVSDEVILTVKSKRAELQDSLLLNKTLRESLKEFAGASGDFRFVYPQFCSLSKRNRTSPQIQHLKLLSQTAEAATQLSASRVASLKAYIERSSQENLCNDVVVKIVGEVPSKFARRIKGKTLKNGYRVIQAQPNIVYRVDRNVIAELPKAQSRPTEAIGIITSPKLSPLFSAFSNYNTSEIAGNQLDDDRNGYRDDTFGLVKRVASQPVVTADGSTGSGDGFIPLEIAKDSGENIEYTSESAAQGMLYALHRGVSRVLAPFDPKDELLLKLSGRSNLAGTLVDQNPEMTRSHMVAFTPAGTTASLQGTVTLTGGGLPLYGSAIALYADNTYDLAFLDTIRVPSNNQATYYFSRLPVGKPFKLMISVEGALFTSNGSPALTMTVTNPNISTVVNFSGSALPNRRQSINMRVTDSANQPFSGVHEMIYVNSKEFNLFPGEPNVIDAYTDIDGIANISLRVGSFYTLYAPRSQSGEPRKTIVGVALDDTTYNFRLTTQASPTKLCYRLVNASGIPIANRSTQLSVDGRLYANAPSGWDGKGCHTWFPAGSRYLLTSSYGRGEVSGSLPENRTVTLMLDGTSPPSPTSTVGATPTRTRTPTPSFTQPERPTPPQPTPPQPTIRPTTPPVATPTPTTVPTSRPTMTLPATRFFGKVTIRQGLAQIVGREVRYKLEGRFSGEAVLGRVASDGTFWGTVYSNYGDLARVFIQVPGCITTPGEVVEQLYGQYRTDVDFSLSCIVPDPTQAPATPTPTRTATSTPTATPTRTATSTPIVRTPTATPTPPDSGVQKTITGTLQDSSGRPLSGVRVELQERYSYNGYGSPMESINPLSVVTGADGTYTFSGLNPDQIGYLLELKFFSSRYRFPVHSLTVDLTTVQTILTVPVLKSAV